HEQRAVDRVLGMGEAPPSQDQSAVLELDVVGEVAVALADPELPTVPLTESPVRDRGRVLGDFLSNPDQRSLYGAVAVAPQIGLGRIEMQLEAVWATREQWQLASDRALVEGAGLHQGDTDQPTWADGS